MADGPGSPLDARLQLHAGLVLQELREAYQAHLHASRGRGDGPRASEARASEDSASEDSASEDSAADQTCSDVDAVVLRISAAGYSIDAPTYRRIEAGDALPDATEAFLVAVSSALALSRSDADRLLRQLAFDLVRRKLGVDVALRLFSAHSPKGPAS